MKVGFFDPRIINLFFQQTSAVTTILSAILLFIDIPQDYKLKSFVAYLLILFGIYVYLFIKSDKLNNIKINIDGTEVIIKVGDIFNETGYKAIAFNEYFDTKVDNNIISEKSLNGIYINSHIEISEDELNQFIRSYDFEPEEIIEKDLVRLIGNNTKFRLGTIVVHNDYLLTSMAKFDGSNRAVLTMPEYLEFLIRFWDRVNKVYAQKSVSVPIFGSGITRIKGHKNIEDEELLKIMLWTFRISEMRFKYPANLSIIINADKISRINLLDIRSLSNGL